MRIRFEVAACPETSGYVARWDDPKGGGITTQGDTFAELDAMVRDAVVGTFADRPKPCDAWGSPMFGSRGNQDPDAGRSAAPFGLADDNLDFLVQRIEEAEQPVRRESLQAAPEQC